MQSVRDSHPSPEQKRAMIKYCAFVLTVALTLGMVVGQAQEEPQCGVCQSGNYASCESETTYYNCFNGNKLGDLVECDPGSVCSSDSNICVPRDTPGIVNVCASGGSSGGCSVCAEGTQFTCVSRTQAGRCINNKVSFVIDCASDEICVSEAQQTGSICVPQCAADYANLKATCSNEDYTTPTPAPATTPSPEDRQNVCQEASAGVTTLFFYTYYDATCKTAVYCQRSSLQSTTWDVTLFRTCPASTPYFDTRIRDCVATKPASCSLTTTVAPVTDTTPTSAVTESTPAATSGSSSDATTATTSQASSDGSSTVPSDTSTTVIPSADSSTTVIPSADTSTTIIPSADTSTTVIPSADTSTTVIPSADTSTTVIPSSETPRDTRALPSLISNLRNMI